MSKLVYDLLHSYEANCTHFLEKTFLELIVQEWISVDVAKLPSLVMEQFTLSSAVYHSACPHGMLPSF